jgi:hypothetical protein
VCGVVCHRVGQGRSRILAARARPW